MPVPIGVAGELCISGAGVARGYLDRPELTAQCFAADPFGSEPNARRYKTGDLVRRLPDGNLEFLGRRDAQLKLRGYRIEAGEIETILTQHEAVQHAVVFAREDRPGDKRLVAYVVLASGRSSTRGDLQAFLAAKLPEYMVPTAFVFVKALPVSASGKVDREQLPAPDRESFAAEEAQQVSPRDPIEAQLASIFAEVLGIEGIGVHADFFQFGGDSLRAVQVLSRVRSVFGTSVSIPSFFSGPTVARVAQHVRADRESSTAAAE